MSRPDDPRAFGARRAALGVALLLVLVGAPLRAQDDDLPIASWLAGLRAARADTVGAWLATHPQRGFDALLALQRAHAASGRLGGDAILVQGAADLHRALAGTSLHDAARRLHALWAARDTLAWQRERKDIADWASGARPAPRPSPADEASLWRGPAWAAEADLHAEQGNLEAARRWARQRVALAEGLAWLPWVLDSHRDAAGLARRAQDERAAESHWQHARAAAREMGAWDAAIDAGMARHALLRRSTRREEMVRHLRAVLEDAEGHATGARLHRVRRRAANDLGWFAGTAEGLAIARRLASAAEARDRPREQAEARLCLGRLQFRAGERSEGLQGMESALAVPLPDPPALVHVEAQVSLAWGWASCGAPEPAAHHARLALRGAARRGWRSLQASAANWLAGAQLQLGAFEEARRHADLAMRLFRALRQPSSRASAQVRLAAALGHLGRHEEALAAFDEAAIAFQGVKATLSLAFLACHRAEMWLAADAPQKALDDADAWIDLRGHAGGLRSLRAWQQDLRARALLALGRHPEALAAAEASVEARRLLERGFGAFAPSGLGSGRWMATHTGIRAAAHLLRTGAPADIAARAFHLFEVSRASGMLRRLHHRDVLLAARLPPALVSALRQGRREIRRTRDVLAEALGTGTSLESAQSNADAALARYAALVERVERQALQMVDLVRLERATLAGLQARLGRAEAWIAWSLGPERILAMVVRHDAAHLVDLGPRAGLDPDMARWLGRLATDGAAEASWARALGSRLLGPLAPWLEGTTHWSLCPDGALARLPVGALIETDADGTERRVIERVVLTHHPSATVYLTRRKVDATPGALPPTTVGIAVTRGQGPAGLPLPDLPHVRAEVDAVLQTVPPGDRRRLVDDHATVSAVGALLARPPDGWGLVHLACHAHVDPDRPSRQGLVLADGVWWADDIGRARCSAAGVLLSGCDTAVGPATPGEGPLGLVRAFHLAGADRVVAALWSVPDASTPAWMRAVHEVARQDRRSLAHALRAAALARLRGGGALAHPYHWAAFTLWGPP